MMISGMLCWMTPSRRNVRVECVGVELKADDGMRRLSWVIISLIELFDREV